MTSVVDYRGVLVRARSLGRLPAGARAYLPLITANPSEHASSPPAAANMMALWATV